jgi:EAL domain
VPLGGLAGGRGVGEPGHIGVCAAADVAGERDVHVFLGDGELGQVVVAVGGLLDEAADGFHAGFAADAGEVGSGAPFGLRAECGEAPPAAAVCRRERIRPAVPRPDFVGCVRRVLASSELPPSSLLLELMESVLLHRDEQVRTSLDELKSIGVRLALNDFRTGYSSLNQLRELPLDVLKIEKSFVDGIAVSSQRQALAEVIIRIAKTLRLTVIASGIETEAQRDLLISIGCPFGQGYLMSRPLGADVAEALVRVGRTLAPKLPAAVS